MVDGWLVEAMAAYNAESLENRDGYRGLVHMPGECLEQIVLWSLESLPDEILVGLDTDQQRPHVAEVDEAYQGVEHELELFAGQGFVLTEPTIVNRGDSFSVHHVPEEWTDGIFTETRGPRGGRFVHWLHTHPNAVAIPSAQDADAAQYTLGVDMILGIQFSPEGPLPWFEDAEGVRRQLQPDEVAARDGQSGRASAHHKTRRRGWGSRRHRQRPVLGIAPTGHRIHGLELISFHRSGSGINVIFIDDDGYPYGWQRHHSDST
uniref:JAB domain-containing protein n=1 Tax=uncultured marine group II/III euryarchaeote KM3_155_G07 TaxID=1457898 RepID=A0A075GKQ6_9EURY|nr:hypothetical protein [uncultured marine group II/III euryarchaeote KM3_155_G07]